MVFSTAEVIFVTGSGKSAIEDHFDVDLGLEAALSAPGKEALLAQVREVSSLVEVAH